MSKNPCELEIDLLCKGLRIDPGCPDGRGRPLTKTRAGLGSGLEIVLPGASPLGRPVWMNAPVLESFADESPYVLTWRDGHEIRDEQSGAHYAVRLPEEPTWYRRTTKGGAEMRRVGVLQGTYLGIYVEAPCLFWHGKHPRNCRFCATGRNVEAGEQAKKSVEDVVETALAAKEESGVTFVHLNTGYQGGKAARAMLPYVQALKERVGVLVGVQTAPEGPLSEYDALIDAGCDHFSFCFEFFDPAIFKQICPGKASSMGQKKFFAALEYCQSRMPKGSCSGELIAGIEPVPTTLKAIDYVTSIGAFPTVCIFRPLRESALAEWPSPSYEEMLPVMRHLWKSCRDRGIPIGIAPNVEVSLVVQPTDTAYLAEGTWRDRFYLWRLGLLRTLAKPRFRRRMRVGG